MLAGDAIGACHDSLEILQLGRKRRKAIKDAYRLDRVVEVGAILSKSRLLSLETQALWSRRFMISPPLPPCLVGEHIGHWIGNLGIELPISGVASPRWEGSFA